LVGSQFVLSSSDARDRRTPWQGSQKARDYVRARLAGIIQADSSTLGGQKYRRHGTGQGRTYRLRGSVTQGERVLFTGTNKDQARTKAGRQNDTALISIAAVIEPKAGGESAVPTTGGLDSSFAASAASTRRSGDREGGGQEEEGASNHTEDTAEEGGSCTEGEGTIEGMGSSIRGGGGESFLSEQEGRGRRLFQLLHRRRGPSRRSRSRLRRPQGAVRFSALHGRSGGGQGEGLSGGRGGGDLRGQTEGGYQEGMRGPQRAVPCVQSLGRALHDPRLHGWHRTLAHFGTIEEASSD
jgi:hypothetical protein